MSATKRYDNRVEQVATEINDGRSPLLAEGITANAPWIGAIRVHPPTGDSMTQSQAYTLVNRNLPDGLVCESEEIGDYTVEVRIAEE